VQDPDRGRRSQRSGRGGCLRPHVDPRKYRGLNRIIVNGVGREAMFGAIYISAGKGTVVRAFLRPGDSGQEKRYDSVADIRAVLKSWAERQRCPG